MVIVVSTALHWQYINLCVSNPCVGTWNQPAWNRNAQQEYLDQHIEGAVRFDINVVCDTDSPLPLTLPTASQFVEHVQKVCVCVHAHACVCIWVGGCVYACIRFVL